MRSRVETGPKEQENNVVIRLKERWNNMSLAGRASVAYAASNILQRGLSFITLPLFTRLLTTEQYGQATVYSSWMMILSIFITLNLAYGSFSTAMMKYEHDRDGYISAVEGICTLLAILFLTIYLPFSSLWDKLFELPTEMIILMTVEILTSTATILWNGKQRFDFKYKSIITVSLITSILSPILAYILVIHSEEKGIARITGYALIQIVIGGVIFIVEVIRGRKFYNREYWKYAFCFNIPLLTYYLSQFIFNQSDRIMISHMIGTDKAGIYGVGYALGIILSFVLNAINNAYVPWFYMKIRDGKTDENRKVANGIALLMAVFLFFVMLFAPEVIQLMAGNRYREAMYVVPPVSISLLLLFYSQLTINVEFYFEEKKKLILPSIVAAAANIVLNYIAIIRFGFVAAAYTTLFSYMLFCLLNYYAMKKTLNERKLPDEAYDYRTLLIILGGLSGLTVLGVLIYDNILLRLGLALAIVIIVMSKWYYFMRIVSEFMGKQRGKENLWKAS